MVITGVTILLFVLYHLAHLTLGMTHPEHHELTEQFTSAAGVTLTRPDVFSMVVLGFQQPLIAVLYIAAMALLALHLSHGAQSFFQSLGLNHPRYELLIRRVGVGLAWVIFLGNISMPVAVLAGDYQKVRDETAAALAPLSAAEREAVWSKTASSFYRLGGEA